MLFLRPAVLVALAVAITAWRAARGRGRAGGGGGGRGGGGGGGGRGGGGGGAGGGGGGGGGPCRAGGEALWDSWWRTATAPPAAVAPITATTVTLAVRPPASPA